MKRIFVFSAIVAVLGLALATYNNKWVVSVASQPEIASKHLPVSELPTPPYLAPKLSTPELTRFANRTLSMEERFTGEVLSSIPRVTNPSDIAALVAVLTDVQDSDSVRNEAANILARSQAYELQPALVRVLENSQEKPRFRSFATQHLGGFLSVPSMEARHSAAEKLRLLMSDKDVEVRREAVWSLVKNRDLEAEALALQWLSSLAPAAEQNRDLAVRCVVQMNRREFLPRLRELAYSPHETTRIAALHALSTWNDVQSRNLFESAAIDKSERVRRAGTAAVQRLDSLDQLLPPEKQTVENLDIALRHERAQVRHEAAIALLRYKQMALPAFSALNEALLKLPSDTRTAHIVVYLDVLRNLGPRAKGAAPALSELMAERAAIYKDRRKPEVHRLRSYILLTLSDIDAVDTAVPFMVEALANSDDEMVFNFAAAARVAGRLGAQAAPLVPLLIRPLNKGLKDSVVTLENYHAPITPSNKTSASLEAIRALALIGAGASEAIPHLEKIANTENPLGKGLPDCRVEARRALSIIRGTAGF